MPTPMYGVTSSLAENFSDRNGVTALMLQAKILDRVSSGPFRRSITIAWPIRSMTSARWDSSPTRVSSVTGCPVQVFVPAAKFATISFAVSLPGRSRYPSRGSKPDFRDDHCWGADRLNPGHTSQARVRIVPSWQRSAISCANFVNR